MASKENLLLYIALGSVSPFFCAIIMLAKIFDKKLSWDVQKWQKSGTVNEL